MNRARAVRWVVALTALSFFALCAGGATARYGAVLGANLVPVAVLAVECRRRGRADRGAWVLMLVGIAAIALHNAQNLVSVDRAGTLATGPAAAATLTLGYVLLLVGGLLAMAPFVRGDRGGMLDAAMIGLAVASLMWAAVLHPALARLGAGTARLVYEMSLVLVVTALTGMVARLVAVAPPVRTAAVCLLVAIGTTDLSDLALTLTEDRVTGLSAWWASLPCVVALVAFAVALLDPSIRSAPGARSVDAPRGAAITPARLVFLCAALVVNPLLTGVEQLLDRSVDVLLLSLGSLFMAPLAAVRIGSLARRQAEAERRLHDLASLDELTGLLNRRALRAHLDALLERVAAGASPGAVVLYVDLDDFKSVNDTHGHLVGDQLLGAVAARLRGHVRSGDVVARLGGDEFVVVLEAEPGAASDAVVATIERAFAEPVAVAGAVASGHASVGVAVARAGRSTDAETLLREADARMYVAKRRRQECGRVQQDA